MATVNEANAGGTYDDPGLKVSWWLPSQQPSLQTKNTATVNSTLSRRGTQGRWQRRRRRANGGAPVRRRGRHYDRR